ncbi:MAG: hypothetical protein ACRDOH_15085 [Streptosporangiaceae bacterium]
MLRQLGAAWADGDTLKQGFIDALTITVIGTRSGPGRSSCWPRRATRSFVSSRSCATATPVAHLLPPCRRITFYDIDSRRIEKHLTDEGRILQLKEIKAGISYFKRSYERADLHVTIDGLDPEASAAAIDAQLGHS